MTVWESIFLGIVQGITEFLPVSSSGHLVLAQYFLGFKNLDKYLLFNIICHLGTLCAIFYVLLDKIKAGITSLQTYWQVILGTLPLFPLVLILKPIKAVFDQPEYLGFCFLFSFIMIFASSLFQLKRAPQVKKDALTIGAFQAIAVLPGISRSGSTISAARILGWQPEQAVTFSFLLAIPAILGATVLEVAQLFKAAELPAVPLLQYFFGFLTSFVIGVASLKLLIRLTIQNKWIYFAWYCLFISMLTFYFFNF